MISGMTKTTMLFIRKALEQCARCPGFYGAVLSTPDGLVLVSTGELSGDEPAACASGLIVDSTKNIGIVAPGEVSEVLVWSANRLWCVRVLASGYILLLVSSDPEQSVAIRAVAAETDEMLTQALRFLG